MKPALGDVATYTRAGANERGPAEEYTARITRVVPCAEVDEADWTERGFEVYLAVDIHNAKRAETWFTPGPITFDPEGKDNTWRWPDRA